jgi:hypothetical protein
MERALLHQFVYFAGEAYTVNRAHPLSVYHKMLSLLIYGWSVEGTQRGLAEKLYDQAWDYALGLREPTDSSHYMDLNYLQRIHEEFASFERLSRRHSRILDRLENLAAKAGQIKDGTGGHRPKVYFDVMSYVTVGGTAVSLVGIVCLIAMLADINFETVKDAVNTLWDVASDTVFGAAEIDDAGGFTEGWLADAGGFTEPLRNSSIVSIAADLGLYNDALFTS